VSVDGFPLNECQGRTFTVDGNTRYASIYYTLDTTAGNHWIVTHTQATAELDDMVLAYQNFYGQSGREYNVGTCGGHLRAKVQVGDGWSGIAWWPNSCFIGLDSMCIRGNCQSTTIHEVRHKSFQFAYNDCVDDWKSGYSGNADIVEGDADYGRSTVINGYFNNSYNPNNSFYDHGYGNRGIFYLGEQTALGLGPTTSPGDVDYLSEGMVHHMELCELYDDLYVERENVESTTSFTYEEFFVNFFAANYLNKYADSATQPELYYFEADVAGVTVSDLPVDHDDNLTSGSSKSYLNETPDDTWAGNYYQFNPQTGCDFVNLSGEGDGTLGWAFMAADTVGTTSAEYSGWVGSEFARTFAADGTHDLVTAGVVAFSNKYDYDITATCVNPQIEIVLPLNPNHVAYVGDPLSPIAFLAYIKVSDGATPVTGIPPSWFVFDADGDAVTVDTLYEVTKGTYLGVLIPPTKAAGTTWMDLRGCLDTTGICDTNADSLLYVAPGNVDMVLLHDASGSMGDIDVPGDYSRLEQARIAAKLLVLLARNGDYYGIMDFSAEDSPPGCNPNCPHDNKIIYPKTEITNPATQIPLLQAAISTMSDREWTNLGQGLVDAQLMALAAPYSDNNKVVTVLSDGEENINPMYDDISASISVIVNTWGFSGDAPNDLLARIAAEKGGTFTYVSTSPGSTLHASEAEQESFLYQVSSVLQDGGVSLEYAEEIAKMLAPQFEYLPGGLALADSYDYLHTEESGGARIMQGMHTGVADNTWSYQSAIVSEVDNTLLMVSSSSQPEWGSCSGWKRDVEVLIPGSGQRDWIPISPPVSVPPNWDVRNSSFPSYSDAVYVSNPISGTWQIRTKMYYVVCRGESIPSQTDLSSDYIMDGSVWSTINLDGQIPLDNGQGMIGDEVPIIGTLLQKNGAMPNALVLALVEKPGSGFDLFWLRDDGLSNDGAAGDGMYGNTYFKSTQGGAYNVSILAIVEDPSSPGQSLSRLWKGSYYMEGDFQETDDDRFPPWWEDRYPCMNNSRYDNPQGDYDEDGAINWVEWEYGTNPCDPDTDDGGEQDGSEIAGGRNPHWAPDDRVYPIFHWSLTALNQAIRIQWSKPFSYTRVLVDVEMPDGNHETHDGGQAGELVIPLTNDLTYNVFLWGETEDGTGPPTEPVEVVPKTDPDHPSGFILIAEGDATTGQKDVQLYVNASDELIDGMPSPSAPFGTSSISFDWNATNEVSGNVEMRFTNNLAEPWSSWEPYVMFKSWTLDCNYGELCQTYAMFRDGAGNESPVVLDEIILEVSVYLPIIVR